MSRAGAFGARLYRGEVSYDFVGRQRTWYAISGVILLVSVAALLLRGLTLGIEFKGGAVFTFQARGATVAEARAAARQAGVGDAIVTEVGDQLRVQTPPLSPEQVDRVQHAFATEVGVNPDDLSPQVVGPTWGEQITKRAVQGLVVFLVLVVGYLSARFEFKMAVAAIVALLHDLVITIGIYALVGFPVTPATVIGLLTILGYSLYDTVVVFDKVKENTAGIVGGSRMTYGQAANLAVNQTLVRSINTSVIALLPVASILFVGAYLLHADTLKDLSLALLVGMAAGTYSSIFIATPLLADLKEREPQMQALAKRVAARQGGGGARGRAADLAEPSTAADESAPGTPSETVEAAGGERTPVPPAAPAQARGGSSGGTRPARSAAQRRRPGGPPRRPPGKRRR
ncbi:MAG TPA: protein translocase subunit SecF [Mycobacteriales bacterium]|nr:protein translocase subunit SecF [Mycobacteriales bacterium]